MTTPSFSGIAVVAVAISLVSGAKAGAETAEAVFAARAAKPTLTRTVSLRDLGFLQPIVFSGADAERQIFFGIPREIPTLDARLTLAGTHLKTPNGRMTLLTDLGGRPVATIDFEGSEGAFSRDIPIPADAPVDGFLRAGLKFSAVGSGDRCADQRSIGNVVTLDPSTRVTFDVDPRDIRGIRSAWDILPRDTRVLLSGASLTTAQFDAAARIALAVHTSGREPTFVALPEIGSWVSTSELRGLDEFAEVPVFREFIDAAGKARLDGRAARGAYFVLSALSGRSPGDIVVDGAAVREIIDGDLAALRTELDKESPSVSAAMDRWLAAVERPATGGGDENLSLVLAFGFPQLRFDTETAPVSAALMGGRWRRLARTAALTAHEVKDGRRSADYLPLSTLSNNFGAQAIIDYGEWAVSFSAAQLPPERWPTSVDIEMQVSPDSADATPVASILLNDTLLRARKVDPESSVFRMTADIPRFLLGANNTLKIALQRGALAGECKAVPRGYPAQLLPTSRVTLGKASIDGQFFGLLPRFADKAAVFIPDDYLRRPLEALPFTVAFMRALSVTPASLRLAVADKNTSFKPDHTFLAFGSALPGARGGVGIKGDRLTLTDDDKEVLFDMTGVGAVAVAQIGEIGGVNGVLVDSRSDGPLPAVKVEQLAAGDVAVVDGTGIIAELGASERKAAAIDRALYEPAELVYRYREYLMVGFSVLFALVLMRVIRGVVVARKRRRRDQAGEG